MLASHALNSRPYQRPGNPSNIYGWTVKMQLAPCTSQGVGSGVGPHVAPVGRTIKCRHARGCNRDQAHTACRSASMKTWARSEGPSEHGMAAYSLESENGAASQGSSMAATPGSSHRRHLLQSSLLAGAFLFCRPGASLAASARSAFCTCQPWALPPPPPLHGGGARRWSMPAEGTVHAPACYLWGAPSPCVGVSILAVSHSPC